MSGASTGAIICTLLQIGVNEFDVARVRYLSRLQSAHSESTTPSTRPPSAEEPLDQPQLVSPPEPKQPLSERILDRMGLFGKISDEEYLEMMKKKRDGYLVRMEHLRHQLEAEKAEKEFQDEEKRRTTT